MKVGVLGLWHLGSVTAACLAAAQHDVVGVDIDAATIESLRVGKAPVSEPGLNELIASGLDSKHLRFSTDAAALADSEVVWVAYDTPVDDEDRADVEFVVREIERVLPHVRRDVLVLISSQLPVGTASRLEKTAAALRPDAQIHFACSPENLRLGKALAVFQQPDRVVVGVRHDADRAKVSALLAPITSRIEWMSVESAEMTKHALNAFLATCVSFANEIASLCEVTGADAKEVERGLKSESRIGPGAYLGPGAAFAGGTLARDLMFLAQLADQHQRPARLLSAARTSNDAHKHWAVQRLALELGDLRGHRIAVWGLTYKPGTDTLRRSSAVEMCERLAASGATVFAHDPAVKTLPAELDGKITLAASPIEALQGASALVVATAWPEYRNIPAADVVAALARPCVLDAASFLAATLGAEPRLRYLTVGRGAR